MSKALTSRRDEPVTRRRGVPVVSAAWASAFCCSTSLPHLQHQPLERAELGVESADDVPLSVPTMTAARISRKRPVM